MYNGEKFNSITHLVGSVLSLMGLGALLAVSILHRDPLLIFSFTIFGVTLVILYTVSTLYHSFFTPVVKNIFQKLDHIAIYLLIAGTYTPYMLVSIGDGNGPILLALVWGLAIIGILIELFKARRSEALQITIYLAMGWACTLDFANLQAALPSAGIIWLIIGGIAYSVGVIFYVLDNMNKLSHAHGIWHLFVLLGSLSHFISIIAYVR
ncbi:MAG: hemolysin III family protein [Thiohalomonadales bacterium]